MAKSKSTTKTIVRMTLSGLISVIILILGIKYCRQFFFSSYGYTEGVILAESDRVKSATVTKIDLTITDQTTLDDIAHFLYENQIITDEKYFIYEAKLEGSSNGFIPGDYTISSNMSSTKILEILTTPVNDEDSTVKFTIPEGYTIEQIAETLDEEGIVSKKDFLSAITSRDFSLEYDFLKELPNHSGYKYALEGYLFPDTYIVRKDTSPEEIIVKMLDRFEDIYSNYSSYAHSTGYSTHQLLTIASIIEQEAKINEERATISGVIYNRLSDGMRLQMCSTVQYALNKRKSNLTYTDLEKDSPYNTYINDGLPIGPICNPGEACIKAALFPESNDYYYFVLKDSETGSHAFSSTIGEHNTEKALYKQTEDINFTE